MFRKIHERAFLGNKIQGITEGRAGNMTDKRIMKTRKAVHAAMTKLLANKPIEEITVTELAEAADINRKTFYNNYSSVNAVAEEMEDELIMRFEETLSRIDFDSLIKDPQTTFNTLARLITSDLDFYGNILTNRNQVFFLQKIISSLKERVMTLYAHQISANEELVEYMLDYIVAGMVSVYQRWFMSGMKMDIETLSRKISTLVVYGLEDLLEEEKRGGA